MAPLFFATPSTNTIPTGLQHASPALMEYIKAFGIGLVAVSFTYGGYQQTINFGADVENPRKNIPRGIFIGIFIIITLYLAINYAYLNVIGFQNLKGAKNIAATALATTMTASAAAAFSWIVFDAMRGRLPSAMGSCIGAVVGLVAITPAAGFISIPHALAVGIISSIISNLMVELRTRSSVDDTLDVFPCHGVGGIVGMILTGVFASKNINGAVLDNGLLFGETKLFFIQLVAMLAVSVFCFVASFVLLKITDLITPLRVSHAEEGEGLDLSQHGESL
jgi:ammonia channel protein AmtB